MVGCQAMGMGQQSLVTFVLVHRCHGGLGAEEGRGGQKVNVMGTGHVTTIPTCSQGRGMVLGPCVEVGYF